MDNQFQSEMEGLQLGHAVNLLRGSAALPMGWPALAAALRMPLRLFPAESVRPPDFGWQRLCASMYRGADALLEQLWDCRVQPLLFELPGFEVVPARLVRHDCDRAMRKERMEDLLGLRLTEDRTYLLFKLRRTDGRAEHEVTARPARAYFNRERHLTADWKRAASRLRPGTRVHDGFEHDAVITAGIAQPYLDCMYEYGTHFVSGIETGDTLLQVAAIRPELAERVYAHWAQISNGAAVYGEEALGMSAFLGPSCAFEVGGIVSQAQDPALSVTQESGVWNDPSAFGGVSLAGALRTSHEETRAALTTFHSHAVIRTELTSLARFLEYYRAIAFERVLRGGLMQRWGRRVNLPLRRMPSVERAIGAAAVADNAPADRDAVQPIKRCGRVISLHRSEALQQGSAIVAQYLDAAPMSRLAPAIRLHDSEFENPAIVCQKMVGAMFLEDWDGGLRDAVVDGLRFTHDLPACRTEEPKVRLRGDLHSTQVECLLAALPWIAAELERCGAGFACAAAPEQHPRSASFAKWIAESLKVGSGQKDLRQLRVLALYQCAIEAAFWTKDRVLDTGDLILTPDERRNVRRHLHAISSCAIEADICLRDHSAVNRAHADSEIFESAHIRMQRKLRALREEASGHYVSVLETVLRKLEPMIQNAEEEFRASSRQALESAGASWKHLGALEPASSQQLAADRLVQWMISALEQPAEQERRAQLHTEPAQNEAQSILAPYLHHEAIAHARIHTVKLLEELCRFSDGQKADIAVMEQLLSEIVDNTEAAESSEFVPVDRYFADLVANGPGDAAVSWIQAISSHWKLFESARARLLALRFQRSCLHLEAWRLRSNGLQANPAAGFGGISLLSLGGQTEHLRLLALVRKSLRLQQLVHGFADSGEAIGDLELGALGHLIAFQCADMLDPAVGCLRMPEGSHV